MARTNTLSNYLTDIGNAIREKTGETEPIKATEFDTKINEIDTGINIDGIIKEYEVASGGNVNAGDFVKYINETISKGTDTQLSTGVGTGNYISAVKLSENKVFIAYSYTTDTDTSASSIYYLYGLVCTISGNLITKGTDTKLSTIDNSGRVVSAVLLSENKVFISHSSGSSSTRYLYGIVCTISGNLITKGTDTKLSTIDKSGTAISAVLLSENKVFIAHSYDTTRYLYGLVCTISGNLITKGTDTKLSTSATSLIEISAVALSDTKVFIAHNSGSNSASYLYGIVCTINGTTITAGTDIKLSSGSFSGSAISAVKLSSTKVFIAHSYDTTCYLYGLVCTIVGTTITQGTDTQLSTYHYTGDTVSAVLLSENKVLIAHSYNVYSSLYIIVCTINGTTITAGIDIQLNKDNYSGNIISTILLPNAQVFIAHNYTIDFYLYGIINSITNAGIAQLENSTDKIFGIAENTGSSGAKVNIYTPNI